MAVSYDESKAKLPWPEPSDVGTLIQRYEERVDTALREGSQSAKIERKNEHIDYVCVRLLADASDNSNLNRETHLHEPLEQRYLAAGWDYAKVEVGGDFQAPYLCLGRARHPLWVETVDGETFRTVPHVGETVARAASRIAQEGVQRATSDGWAFIPPTRIHQVRYSAVPDVNAPPTY